MKNAIKRAGCPSTTIKGLRHTFATGVEMQGTPRSVRKAIMGQSTRSDIGEHYVHPSLANMRYSLEKWAARLRLDRSECLPGSGVPSGVRDFSLNGVRRAG